MIITYIKNIFEKHNIAKDHIIFLKDIIKRLHYIASSISGTNTDLIESNDNFGGYLKDKIILPYKIDNSLDKNKNLNLYIYKIILFTYLSKFQNNENNNNSIYINLSLILKIKYIRKKIKNDMMNLNVLEKNIYPLMENIIPEGRKNLLLKIIIDKITFNIKDYKVMLNNNEKLLLYKFENVINLKYKNFNHVLEKAYILLNNIKLKHETFKIFHFWGYKYIDTFNKNNKATHEKNCKKILVKDLNIPLKRNIIKKNIHKNHTLNTLFNYNKTLDKYNKNTNSILQNSNKSNIENINNDDINNSTRINYNVKYIMKNTIIVSNTAQTYKDQNLNFYKKYEYNEWDFKLNNYKENWCKIFEKIDSSGKINYETKKMVNNFTLQYKKEIFFIKNNLTFLLNKETWKKKQNDGTEIDFDNIINNYNEFKNLNFDKIYKYKKKTEHDNAFLLLLDASFSVDSYLNNGVKKLNLIKIITLILSLAFEKNISYEICTFNSNTRHDCRYTILKSFKEQLYKKKYNILNMSANGYTRIGPAIRHSIYKLSKQNEKKKYILLLTDGNPTDYDEYEGIYGMKDIKHAFTEALNKKIQIKTILINNIKETHFSNILGFNKCVFLDKITSNKLLEIFNNLH